MKIWCMRILRWVPKATNTYLQYVTFIAFPLQRWLQELASLLRLTYSTLPVFFYFLFVNVAQKLALTSPTGGGRSVGIVRSRTKATEFFKRRIKAVKPRRLLRDSRQ